MISIACGFSDIKYFNQGFARQFGCSPRQYRNAFEREELSRQQKSMLSTQDFLSPAASRMTLGRYPALIHRVVLKGTYDSHKMFSVSKIFRRAIRPILVRKRDSITSSGMLACLAGVYKTVEGEVHSYVRLDDFFGDSRGYLTS